MGLSILGIIELIYCKYIYIIFRFVLIKELKIKIDLKVEFVFNEYFVLVWDKMLFFWYLVIEIVKVIDGIEEFEEILKWGEFSYLIKIGSMLRVDWKFKNLG